VESLAELGQQLAHVEGHVVRVEILPAVVTRVVEFQEQVENLNDLGTAGQVDMVEMPGPFIPVVAVNDLFDEARELLAYSEL